MASSGETTLQVLLLRGGRPAVAEVLTWHTHGTQVFDDIAKRLPRAAPPPPVAGGITLDAPRQAAKKSACC